MPAVALLLSLLSFGPAEPASAARPIPPPLHVLITDAGFVPENVSVSIGQSVVFENHRAGVESVTATDGLFASGPIHAGGAYVMALGQLGIHGFESAGPAPFAGTVAVGALGLEGDDNQFAQFFVPTDPPYPLDGPAIDFHPTLGFSAARNRLLFTVAQSALVGAVNAALAVAGVTVVGGFERWGIIAVEVPDTGDAATWTRLDEAVAALEANSAIGTVTYDVEMQAANEIPRPSSPAPINTWVWDDLRYAAGTESPGSARGDGRNDWLEAARFPQAWNWYDALFKKNSQVDTIVIDTGFNPAQPDLRFASFPKLCIPGPDKQICTYTTDLQPDSAIPHGTGTAAVVGGEYDRTGRAPSVSVGVPGANPFADVTMTRETSNIQEIEYKNPHKLTQSRFLLYFDIVMANRDQYPGLRVMTMSLGQFLYGQPQGTWNEWNETRAGHLCGPGGADDAGGTEPCTPMNDDANLKWVAAAGETLRAAFQDMGQSNIMFTKSSGNSSGPYSMCIGPGPGCTHIVVPSASIDPVSWLARNWTGPGTNPLLLVEAWSNVDPAGPRRADYANTGGDVSAIGDVFTSSYKPGQTTHYESFKGTSFAAPQVAALAGLLWEFNPSLTLAQVRSLIVANARNDVVDVDAGATAIPGQFAAPRIDAYASMMAALGGAIALVDVNDASTDGNRRLQWVGNTATPDVAFGPSGSYASPDGAVDMRDFRRFRDAWLQICIADNTRADCPDTLDIDLDGAPGHPKRDLNRDRCIGSVQLTGPAETVPCAGEEIFSRFDFNADGQISPTSQARVPITAAGAPASMGTGIDVSDLGVLQAKWTGGDGSNVPSAALTGLMNSADVAIDVSEVAAFADAGAAVSTFVRSGPTGTATPPNAPTANKPHIVTSAVDLTDTLPPGGQTNLLEPWAVTSVDGTTQSFVGKQVPAFAGSDLRTKICADTLVTSEGGALPVGTTVSAELNYVASDCGAPRVGVPMRYEIVGDALGSELVAPQATTNALGQAKVMLRAGTSNGVVTVRAWAAVGLGGGEVSRDIRVTMGDGLAVHYLWQETLLDWEVDATNQWGTGEDDCDANPLNPPRTAKLCFSAHAWLRPDSGFTNLNGVPTYANRRRGVVKLDDTGETVLDEDVNAVMIAGGTETRGWQISEHVDNYLQGGTPNFDPTLCDSYQSGQCPVNVTHFSYFRPGEGLTPDQWAINWRDNPVDGLDLETRPDGLLVSGLRNIGAQIPPLTWSPTNSTHDDAPLQAPNYPSEILLLPRENGSNFQYGTDLDTPVEFVEDGLGGYDPYSYCGVVEQDLEVGPGYWANDDDDLADGIRDRTTRRPTRLAGDRAAPQFDGIAKSRIQFVAVVAPADADPVLSLETCTETEPDLHFTVDQPRVFEGSSVKFASTDPAAGPDAIYSWDFGDATSDFGLEATHTFEQSGTFKVKLTVEDPGEPTRSTERNVVVENVAPVVAVDSLMFDGTNWKLDLTIGEPSMWDALSMRVDVTAPTQPAYAFFTYVTPETGFFNITALPVGTYQLSVKVTDPDGAFSTQILEVSVAEEEEEE
ncbi:MAG: S8 family serine peptidase, partial [Actinomycetota bacterium]|nr:S8 family serine peptidase [Actinomycetota bacterium]